MAKAALATSSLEPAISLKLNEIFKEINDLILMPRI